MNAIPASLQAKVRQAKEKLDAHVREMIAWHFNPETGAPFWIAKAKELGLDPVRQVNSFEDLKIFGHFEDDWLRGGPVRRWVPKALHNKPIYVFETGGTTGIPKSRVVVEDHWIDYELFSEGLPEKFFPKGSNWLMLGPSGPRRLRLAVEHLAQHRGGICFCVDLDPRWVIKLIKRGNMKEMEAYRDHVIEQALTVLSANHNIRCMFTTPKLLEALAMKLFDAGSSIKGAGITGIFSGGTEFTPQWYRFAMEELLRDPADPASEPVYMTPTYGNTLMGLACGKPFDPRDNYKITYYAPQPRAVIEVVDFKDYGRLVDYGKTGRVKLTTLTRETFIPGFMERDEGEREPPFDAYPWDGISGTRPFHETAKTTTVGVY